MAKLTSKNFERVDSFWAIYLEMLSMIDGGNWTDLCSIIDDDRVANAIMQAMGGRTIRIPTVGEHAALIRAAIYAYYRVYVGTGNRGFSFSGQKYKQLFGLSDEEYKSIVAMYKEWSKWVQANGIDPMDYAKLTRSRTDTNDKRLKGSRAAEKMPECLKDYTDKLQKNRDEFLKRYRADWNRQNRSKKTSRQDDGKSTTKN